MKGVGVHIYEIALLRFIQIIKNTKNPKKLKNECTCNADVASEEQYYSRLLHRLLDVAADCGVSVEFKNDLGVAKYGDSSHGIGILDIVLRRTFKSGGIYNYAENKIWLPDNHNFAKQTLKVLVHEFAHALNNIEPEVSMSRKTSHIELLACSVTYMFMSLYGGHVCQNYRYYLKYAIDQGAKARDAWRLKEDIFFVFNKIDTLMQAH